MANPVALPDLAVLQAAFRYDPPSGRMLFRSRGAWRVLRPTPGTRYITVWFGNRRIYAHRVAWKLHYRCEPPDIIDHIDRDRFNNSIANMRAATASLNSANGPHICKYGYGVFYDRKRGYFRARLVRNGRKKYFGYHKTFDAAAAACRAAIEANPDLLA